MRNINSRFTYLRSRERWVTVLTYLLAPTKGMERKRGYKTEGKRVQDREGEGMGGIDFDSLK